MRLYSLGRVVMFSAIAFATAHATSITVGNPITDNSIADTCPACTFILAGGFGAAGLTVTSYTFTANATGTLTAQLFTGTLGPGTITFALAGASAPLAVTAGDTYTVTYSPTSGSAVTGANTYFGFSEVGDIVNFDYFPTTNPVTTAGAYLFAPGGYTSASETTTYQMNTLNGLDNRLYGINATAVSATPEPSSLALMGTGLLTVGGLVRRRLKK